MKYEELIQKTEDWAENKGLLALGDPKSQYLKVQEEYSEMINAFITCDMEEFRDGLGDFQVTLIILMRQMGLSFLEFVEDYINAKDLGIHAVKDNEKLLKITVWLGFLAEGINKKNSTLTEESLKNLFNHMFKFSTLWEMRDCLKIAYDEISGRKGLMVYGSFVKEEDL